MIDLVGGWVGGWVGYLAKLRRRPSVLGTQERHHQHVFFLFQGGRTRQAVPVHTKQIAHFFLRPQGDLTPTGLLWVWETVGGWVGGWCGWMKRLRFGCNRMSE